ncbi:MAG: choice-of-anchor tandem repeat GloVer-containing protein [Candidatus Sulfotelmatobacter sp.]
MTRLNSWRKICVGCLLYAATAMATSADTFTTLAYFTVADGSVPYSSLIQGIDGSLYGTAGNGGANGYGTVFKVTPTGTLSALYSFCSQANCADGAYPGAALVLGTDGNLYGTTSEGGATCAATFGIGCGTVFKLTPGGTLTTLHSFDGTDGNAPGMLVEGSDGNLYGTTGAGGTGNSCVGGCGTVFKMTLAGTITPLHSFNQTDGSIPGGLALGTDGNFYGVTATGGTSNACNGGGCGSVFKITPGGKFTSLHSFSFTDGSTPVAPPVQATSGAFYGTTFEGGNANFHGCTNGCGTIFKISSGGAFATVHKFHFGDGGNPESGLVQATDGNLYGESLLGGTMGGGEIFKVTLPRTLATVSSFDPASGGGGNTAVVQSTDGKFYGTYGVPGAVFSLDVNLNPFIAFVIPTGKPGKAAQILGQGLTGTTSVTFNGVPATSFAVVSDTYMTAVVPIGATTGSVVVTTASGNLTSNVNFRITK